MSNGKKYLAILGLLISVVCDSSEGMQEIAAVESIRVHPLPSIERLTLDENSTFIPLPTVDEFIRKEVQTHPLKQENISQAREDLEALNVHENPNGLIDNAVNGDAPSLELVGGVYASNFAPQQALPWLLAAAEKNDPDSLWLLGSLYSREVIASAFPQIGAQLKKKAFDLKGHEAEEYFYQ